MKVIVPPPRSGDVRWGSRAQTHHIRAECRPPPKPPPLRGGGDCGQVTVLCHRVLAHVRLQEALLLRAAQEWRTGFEPARCLRPSAAQFLLRRGPRRPDRRTRRRRHNAEVADLRAEGFDPRLPPADEPDWNDADKVYSAAVLAEQARMTRRRARLRLSGLVVVAAGDDQRLDRPGMEQRLGLWRAYAQAQEGAAAGDGGRECGQL